MRFIAPRTPSIVLAAVLMLAPGARAQEAAPRVIAVTGTGEVETVPDLAVITAGVSSEAETAAAALSAVAAAMTEVLAAVKAAGIADADVQTSQLSLDAVWAEAPPLQDGRPGLPEVTGYRASNLVTLRLRAVSEVGRVVDALGRAGTNRLFGIAFSLDDPGDALDRAREAAIADARAKAEIFARVAGVGLGPVQSLREAPGGAGPMPLNARAQMAMDMPVAEGSLAVRADVEMVFAIE